MTFLEDLLVKGCALETSLSSPVPLAHAEVINNGLFWVYAYPRSQQDTHYLPFERVEETAVGITFYAKGGELAYVASFQEFPGLDPIEALMYWTSWDMYLDEPGQKEAFDAFVLAERTNLVGEANAQ
jgi:hypothetical protein